MSSPGVADVPSASRHAAAAIGKRTRDRRRNPGLTSAPAVPRSCQRSRIARCRDQPACGRTLLLSAGQPRLPGQPIIAVRSKSMPFGQAWMLERRRIPLHAQPLHHCARPRVRGHGESHDFGHCQPLEADLQSPSRGFGGIPLLPVGARQPPQNLDTRRYGQIGPGNIQPHEADEIAGRLDLGCPWAPATLPDEAFAAVRRRIAFLARQRGREMGHHRRIGIERCKGLPIRSPPLPQQQSRRLELDHDVHSPVSPIARQVCSLPTVRLTAPAVKLRSHAADSPSRGARVSYGFLRNE
jgi:hypothetical protein